MSYFVQILSVLLKITKNEHLEIWVCSKTGKISKTGEHLCVLEKFRGLLGEVGRKGGSTSHLDI